MTLREFFLVGEDNILVEQLRLLLDNVAKSAILRLPLIVLLLWALTTPRNTAAMSVWAAAALASKLSHTLHARYVLAGSIGHRNAWRLIATLALLQAVDGAIWGWLPWIALDMASIPSSMMVFAILAVVASNAMSVVAPVPPVFVGFGISISTLLAGMFWHMDNPAYDGLIVGTLLYVAVLLLVARNGARSARASIALRFENLDLIERLKLAHRAAEDANLAKSKFLAAASHDLRQPIHAQGLFLELLARGELSAAQREVLANARASSAASADMLNTLLDFSRIEAGVVEPAARPFHMQLLLNKIESELAPLAMAKGLVFRVRETAAAVQSDPALVELIVRNLVSNAIRYTDHGGVLLACRLRGDHVLLEVWDTGIGILPAQQQEVFREFHQLGNPERDRRKGLGLGLAIADGLARALGHRLWLASTPGRGSVFRLALPRTRAAVMDDVPPVARRNERLQGVHVLVIDDDEAVLVGMAHLLRDWGCECVVAESIEEALVIARAQRPDIVVSDYRLREQRTGAEAIAAVRAQWGADLPALLITGDTAPERLREARATHVPLLHKPVSPDQLHGKLVELLAGE